VFEIGTNSDRLRANLDYLVQDAAQEYDVEAVIRIEVLYEDGEYIVTEDGRELSRELCAEHTLSRIFGQTQVLALDRMRDWIELHCACIDWHGSRTVIAGPSGAGKTSVALRLMFSGADLLADERVFYRAGKAMPYPRRFHIKQAGLQHHAEIASLALPFFGADERHRVYSLSPHDVGRRWELRPAPIDRIIYLEPNHGGQTRLRSVRRTEMANLLMSQVYSPLGGRPGWIGDIAGLVTRAECAVLWNGDVDESVAEIRRLSSGASRSETGLNGDARCGRNLSQGSISTLGE
jgi:hypothetical protein